MGFDLRGSLSQIDRVDEEGISPVADRLEVFPVDHVFARDDLTRYGGGAGAFIKLLFFKYDSINLSLNA